MKKYHSWLAGLLAAQIVLAGVLFFYKEQSMPQASNEPLLSFESAAIDKLVIADAENTVTLQKSGDQWRLPDLHELPVVDQKVPELLDKLQAVQVRWPVATTTSSHERFEVGEKKFQRKLQLFNGDKKVGEVLLGTSPGFRKVHARRPDDSEVYAVNLNSFDMPAAPLEWLDKTLLGAKDLQKIKGPDYELQKAGEEWILAGTAKEADGDEDQVTVDAEKAQELANALTNLRIINVAEQQPQGEPVVITVGAAGGELQYEFLKQDDNYFVKRSDQSQAFTLSQFDYDRITQIRQPQLAVKVEEQKENTEEKESKG